MSTCMSLPVGLAGHARCLDAYWNPDSKCTWAGKSGSWDEGRLRQDSDVMSTEISPARLAYPSLAFWQIRSVDQNLLTGPFCKI